ncbi:MAG: hypothetical protein ABI162_02010 [Luteolibacter sp.]
MNVTIQAIILILSMHFVLHAEEQSAERKAWLAERRAMVERARTISDEQTIIDLSRIVRGIGSNLPNASEEAKQLYLEALDLLKANPGYAEYYRDRVITARKKYEGAPEGSANQSVYRHDLQDAQNDSFATLQRVPSVESVRVLGEFLSDDRGRITLPKDATEDQRERAKVERPNSSYAAESLFNLPLNYEPRKRRNEYDFKRSDIDLWRVWYEQVKFGKRTFRFVGDPTEYDLDGPAPKEKLQRIERDRKRDEGRAAGHKNSSSGSETASTVAFVGRPMSIAGIFAASGLCATAVWYFLKRRKAA